MSERSDRLSTSDLALLAELADGADDGALTGARRARAEALLTDETCRVEVAEHQRLVASLREHAQPGPSPDWRALEAALQRACEAERQRPRSWLQLLRAWRWPALALGAAAAAAAALALLRTERPSEGHAEVAAPARPSEPAPRTAPPDSPATPDAVAALDLLDAWAALPDEAGWLEPADGRDEEQSGAPQPQELPRAVEITLGLSDDPKRDEDAGAELGTEAGEPWLEELHQLDGESLRRLDAWLDAAKQKG